MNQKAKPVFFNQKGYEISQKEIRDEVYLQLRRFGNYAISSKYYNFLNKKNLFELKDGEFRVSLSSYGKRFVLFLVTIQDKRYSILINKKNEVMIRSQYKFHHDLYEGTLFDGEIVKNENNKWIFIINDLAYYRGRSIVTQSFEERQSIIDSILLNEYSNEDKDQQMTYISKKLFVTIDKTEDLSKRFRESLNYKTSGLYFKNIYNYSDNYLYVFPECRTDHQILNPVQVQEVQEVPDVQVEEIKKDIVERVIEKGDEEDDIFGAVEVVREVPKVVVQEERKVCRFMIRGTVKPDVYELYCRSVDRHTEKYSVAGIPNMDTSRFLKEVMKDADNTSDITSLLREKRAIYVECKYHKIFKKWIPYRRCDDMDHHTFINRMQILLDNQQESDEEESDDDESIIG